MIVSDEDVQKAFDYLKSSELEHAQAKANLEGIKKHEKALIATLKLRSSEKTSAAKEDEAYASNDYDEWEAGLKVAVEVFTLLENKRDRANTAIDLYRTCSANERRL